MFCAFIFCCGLPHLLAVLVLWKPLYVLEDLLDAFAACCSLGVVAMLWTQLPRALKLPSPRQFRASADALAAEIEHHRMDWQQANYDSLTYLPNRRMLMDRLTQEITRARQHGKKIALMFIDLDRFKDVNDNFGHMIGDHLLREAAERIRGVVRASDMVARLGGDEFVVMLPELADTRPPLEVAARLLERLGEAYTLNGTQTVASASIGITFYPDDAEDAYGLLRNGDRAMYVSKEQGRNRYSFFTPELEQRALRRARVLHELRAALRLKQFSLHFQPILDVKTGRIVKAEALIRWAHPELGQVSPLEFIPIAEETGLILPIGDWVFAEALDWVQRWRKLEPDLQMSVNKSPAQFGRENWPAGSLRTLLAERGLNCNCVMIEITEGLLMHAGEAARAMLRAYREAGIHLAIDDFGTGYSSLGYLKTFEIDVIKIDRVFTRELTRGSSDLALIQAIIVMAHALGLKVIAEGVENAEQKQLLEAAGCDFLQGFYMSKPVPPEEFEKLLERQNKKTPDWQILEGSIQPL